MSSLPELLSGNKCNIYDAVSRDEDQYAVVCILHIYLRAFSNINGYVAPPKDGTTEERFSRVLIAAPRLHGASDDDVTVITHFRDVTVIMYRVTP